MIASLLVLACWYSAFVLAFAAIENMMTLIKLKRNGVGLPWSGFIGVSRAYFSSVMWTFKKTLRNQAAFVVVFLLGYITAGLAP